MKDTIKKLLGTSPRTTIVGWLLAGGYAAYALMQAGEKDWKKLLGAFLFAVYARVSKDSNGITREQSKVVAKMATDGVIPPTKLDDNSII